MFQNIKRPQLEEDYRFLIRQQQAVADALRITLNPADKVSLQTQQEGLEKRIRLIEAELDAMKDTSSAASAPVPPTNPNTPSTSPHPSCQKWLKRLSSATALAVIALLCAFLALGCGSLFCQILGLKDVFCAHCYVPPTPTPTPSPTETPPRSPIVAVRASKTPSFAALPTSTATAPQTPDITPLPPTVATPAHTLTVAPSPSATVPTASPTLSATAIASAVVTVTPTTVVTVTPTTFVANTLTPCEVVACETQITNENADGLFNDWREANGAAPLIVDSVLMQRAEEFMQAIRMLPNGESAPQDWIQQNVNPVYNPTPVLNQIVPRYSAPVRIIVLTQTDVISFANVIDSLLAESMRLEDTAFVMYGFYTQQSPNQRHNAILILGGNQK